MHKKNNPDWPTSLSGFFVSCPLAYFPEKTILLVCSYLVYLSTSKIKKSFFSFFTLTPSHMWLKRPVYRGFKGEGKCEGKWFTLTQSSHLPSHSPHTILTLSSHSPPTLPARKLLVSDSTDGVKLWFSGAWAVVYHQYTYAALLVYLCCTVGTSMLYFSGTVFSFCLQWRLLDSLDSFSINYYIPLH